MSYTDFDYPSFLKIFKEVLEERYGDNMNHVELLSDTLNLDKAAVRRRLKGQTQLSVEEFLKICFNLTLPLDRFMKTNHQTEYFMKYFKFSPVEKEEAKRFVEIEEQSIGFVNENNDTRMIETSNTLPPSVFINYPSLSYFFALKWLYHSQVYGIDCRKLKDVYKDEDLQICRQRHLAIMRSYPHTIYIFYDEMMRTFVKEMKYYASIRLLDHEDIENIRRDLYKVLEDLEFASYNGHWINHNKQKIDIYVSHIPHVNEIMSFESSTIKGTNILTTIFNPICSLEYEVVDSLKNWWTSYLRTSDHISISGESRRIAFFEQQRAYLEELVVTE